MWPFSTWMLHTLAVCIGETLLLPVLQYKTNVGVTCENQKWPNISHPDFTWFDACFAHYRNKTKEEVLDRIRWTSIGVGCSNQMQLAQGHHLISCPCATCAWLLHPAPIYTFAQVGLDTVQLALVVLFLSSTSANTPLAFMVVITRCNVRWWWFSWSTSAFTNVRINE